MSTIIILILVSLFVIIIAVNKIITIKKIITDGVYTEGIIYAIEQDGDMRTNILFPTVRYKTSNEDWITKKYSIGTIPYAYKEGKSINIIYNKHKLDEFVIKDKYTYTIPVVMALISTTLIVISLILLINI